MEQRAHTKVFSNIFSGTLFLNNIKRFFFLPILHFLFSLMAPMSMYAGLLSNHGDPGDLKLYVGNAIHILISPIYIMVVACIMVYAVFSYLYSSRNCYMMHAFPVTRLCMYITNVISAFVMLALPTGIITFICIPLGSSLGISVYAEFLSAYVLFILMSIFFISAASFVAMCTGIGVAMPILYFIFNFLGSIVFFIRNIVAGVFFFGSRFSGDESILTPAVKLDQYISFLYIDRTIYDDSFSLASAVTYIAVLMVIALVFFVASYVIYRYKQIESVGSLLPMKWTRPVFSWGVVICACVLISEIITEIFVMSSNPGVVLAIFILVFILGGFLIFFGIQMLIARTIRIFSKAKIIEFTAVTAGIIIILAAVYVNPAEIGVRTPKVNDIASAVIMTDGNVINLDKEDIPKLVEINRNVIDNKKEILENQDWRKNNTHYFSIDITYHMKNNTIVRRNYDFSYSDDESSVVKIGNEFDRFINQPKIMENTILRGKNLNECDPRYLSISAVDERRDSINGSSYVELSKKGEIQPVLEALVMDAREGKVKIFSPDNEWENEDFRYSVSIEYTSDVERDYNANSVYVYKDSTNTLKAIKELTQIE